LLATNARKPIKDSNNAGFRLVFLSKSSTKPPLAVEAQSQMKWVKKT